MEHKIDVDLIKIIVDFEQRCPGFTMRAAPTPDGERELQVIKGKSVFLQKLEPL